MADDDLDAAAAQWREAETDAARGRALARVIHAALAIARRRAEVGPRERLPDAPTVLLGIIEQMEPGAARDRALEDAARVALDEIERAPWRIGALARIAAMHSPSIEATLAIARREQCPREGWPAALWDQERAFAIAWLVRAVAPHERGALASEAVSIARGSEGPTATWPLMGPIADGAGATCADDLLRIVHGSGEWTRGVPEELSRMAASLPEPQRTQAIEGVLAMSPDSEARPLVAIAPLLDEEHARRAITLAERMHPTRYFGALAWRAILPRWAELGHVDDAVARAREIQDPGERGIALGRIVPFAPDAQRRELVREMLASFGATPLAYGYEPGSLAAAVADALVPAGLTRTLLDFADARAACAAAAAGDERRRLVAELVESGCAPDVLAPFASELPIAPLFETFVAGVSAIVRRAALDEVVEDEYGYGLATWTPLLGRLGGQVGLVEVAALLSA